jgi:hypothetical protein
MRGFRARYGAGPGHLVLMVACLALAAYAASFLLGDPSAVRIVVWFVGAAVVHDLLLYPLYAAGDRSLTALLARRSRRAVPLVNHVRVPLLGAGLTLLLFLPGIIRHAEPTHLAATGLDQQPYAAAWGALVAVLVLASAVVYAVRVLLARRNRS